MLMSLFEGDDIVLSFTVKFSTMTPPVAFPVNVIAPLVVFVVIVVLVDFLKDIFVTKW